MTTLAERLEWAIKNCPSPDGSPWDAKPLSLAAGLSGAHVGQMLSGSVVSIREPTAKKLATVLGLSWVWLG